MLQVSEEIVTSRFSTNLVRFWNFWMCLMNVTFFTQLSLSVLQTVLFNRDVFWQKFHQWSSSREWISGISYTKWYFERLMDITTNRSVGRSWSPNGTPSRLMLLLPMNWSILSANNLRNSVWNLAERSNKSNLQHCTRKFCFSAEFQTELSRFKNLLRPVEILILKNWDVFEVWRLS